MRHYILYLVLFMLVVAGVLAEPASSEWLRFDRVLIDQGQIWRLFSANFVHLSVNHALGNAIGIGLLAYIAGQYLNNKHGLLLIVWCGLWVGCGLYWYAEYLQRYVGLSGALHGLLLVAPFVSRYYSKKIAWSFALLISAKIIWEQTPWYNDMAMLGYIGGRVEVNSHLMGYLAGVLYLSALYFLKPELVNHSDEKSLDDA